MSGSPLNYVLPAAATLGGQTMPPQLANAMLRQTGCRLTWFRGHACPCTVDGPIAGAANPRCETCHGRGRYWDQPQEFTGLWTQDDDPGATADTTYGEVLRGQPSVTIGSDQPPWAQAAVLDAFSQRDAPVRFDTVLQVGDDVTLPYRPVQILSVASYDSATRTAVPVPAGQWIINDGSVTLIGFGAGTPYAVAYMAVPLFVAWGKGGVGHRRPFQQAALPVHFNLRSLDLWTRIR